MPATSKTFSFLTALCAAMLAFGPTSAHAVDAGVTDSEIRIGASAVLSGSLGPQTLGYGAGAKLYFDSVNAKGGVNGRKIVYTQVDDGFDVARSVQNSKKLIEEDKVFVLFQPTGTSHTIARWPLKAKRLCLAQSPARRLCAKPPTITCFMCAPATVTRHSASCSSCAR